MSEELSCSFRIVLRKGVVFGFDRFPIYGLARRKLPGSDCPRLRTLCLPFQYLLDAGSLSFLWPSHDLQVFFPMQRVVHVSGLQAG